MAETNPTPRRRVAAATLAALTTACLALATAPAALGDEVPAGPSETSDQGPGSIDVTVAIPDAGALGLELSSTALDLGTAAFDGALAGWSATGSLPELTVVDSRVTDPGWSLTATMTPFVSDDTGAAATPLEATLGLIPRLTEGSDGAQVEVAREAVLLDGVIGELPLAWASAGQGRGRARLGGEVGFLAPADADPGGYAATLTLTVS